MKKLIICLISMLLFSSINLVSAQESKYFDVDNSYKYLVSFTPKNLQESFYRKEGEFTPLGMYKLNKYYYDAFIPIYKDIFGSQHFAKFEGRDNLRFLRAIKCSFYFREDFKPYYFWVTFPADRIDEFPQWEEKLYRFCLKVLDVDVRSFIEIQGEKSLFKGSTFDIDFANLYLFLEGRSLPEDYNWTNSDND